MIFNIVMVVVLSLEAGFCFGMAVATGVLIKSNKKNKDEVVYTKDDLTFSYGYGDGGSDSIHLTK